MTVLNRNSNKIHILNQEIPIETKWQMLNRKVFERKLASLWQILESHNIEALLIKGWAVSTYYDDPFERYPGDIDLVVRPSEREKVLEVLQHVEGLEIDYHFGMRHLDTVDINVLFENSGLIELEETYIRVLSAEDHLRVLCVHWLTDGGERKQKLRDIYYLLKNRPKDFNWDKCLSVVSQRRQLWILSTIGLTYHIYNLDISEFPFKDEIINIPGWFEREVKKRWEEPVYLPLEYVLNDRRQLFEQLKKRFPPNKIMATIEMEGSFKSSTRIHYLFGYFFKKIISTIKRIYFQKTS
jgi:hypothetical protein